MSAICPLTNSRPPCTGGASNPGPPRRPPRPCASCRPRRKLAAGRSPIPARAASACARPPTGASATFGLTTFLYRYVCDNRIIWGQSHVREVRIRHTGGAPERFAYEGQRYLRRYAKESTGELVTGIQTAQHTAIPINQGKDEMVQDWL